MATSAQPPAFQTAVAKAPAHPAIQAALDENHLGLLQIAFYIMGALSILRIIWFIFIAFFFAVGGFAAITAAIHRHDHTQASDAVAQSMMFVFAVVFGVLGFLSILFTALEFYAASCLKKRRNMLLIQIVAGIYCIGLPWGTMLGVCTFLVLARPSVKARFT